jgi:hypothetical protein
MISKINRLRLAFIAGAFAALAGGVAHAFTAQLPIDRFEFAGPLRIIEVVGGGTTIVYEVPDDRIAVITDVFFTPVSDSATDPQRVSLRNNDDAPGGILGPGLVAGPFFVDPQEGFNKALTSGVTFSEGRDIVVSSSAPPASALMVNLVGYLVCRDSCD